MVLTYSDQFPAPSPLTIWLHLHFSFAQTMLFFCWWFCYRCLYSVVLRVRGTSGFWTAVPAFAKRHLLLLPRKPLPWDISALLACSTTTGAILCKEMRLVQERGHTMQTVHCSAWSKGVCVHAAGGGSSSPRSNRLTSI